MYMVHIWNRSCRCYIDFDLFFCQAEDGIRDSSVIGVQTCAFFFQAEDGIRDSSVTGVQTCALPISSISSLKPDDVQISRELISAFDAVGQLPSGEPVRFHCRNWMDRVVWSAQDRGLVIERSTPRLEAVPVKFETY